MRYSSLLLLPLALAAPTKQSSSTPELSVSQWSQVQSGFVDGVRSLSSWSWSKAEEMFEEIESLEKTTKDESELTIWQQLQADTNSFSKLVKIIEFEQKSIKYLDDKDSQITFFAPNNDALTPPHHKHDDDDDAFVQLLNTPSLASLSAVLERDPSLTAADEGNHDDDDDDDDKKKKRKEIFKFIAGKVLQYHGLTKAYTVSELAQNSTIETALKADDGSYASLPRRIRIEKSFVPPSLKINFYAKVLVSDKKARNGYLHTLNHPLIPPGSILEELFLFPETFSTLTSSVQKIHEAHLLEWRYEHSHNSSSLEDHKHAEHGHFHGAPLATLFAPSNAAFHLIPAKLKFYLFSPFGEKALAKVLAYHYLPKTLLLSEVLFTEKHKSSEVDSFVDSVGAYEVFNIADDPSFHKELEVHTALPNATLKIEIDKTKFLPVEGAVKTTIKVNGDYVEVIDIPARNGASHLIGKLLVPPHHHHDHHGEDISSQDSWENWEEWLPAWADEE
ncbi:hypothetical protein IAR55_006161 [Kwoniella newhampshirensis]|uniref:FAS1 domain-containing protein n=1 Tax=Kwoniella newhampshirensis TaxID=1651941 RepID=A0AAW0YXR8_9TREE